MKLHEAYTCLACSEVYLPPTTPLARRACPGCGGDQIVPVSGLLTRWSPPWRREALPAVAGGAGRP